VVFFPAVLAGVFFAGAFLAAALADVLPAGAFFFAAVLSAAVFFAAVLVGAALPADDFLVVALDFFAGMLSPSRLRSPRPSL